MLRKSPYILLLLIITVPFFVGSCTKDDVKTSDLDKAIKEWATIHVTAPGQIYFTLDNNAKIMPKDTTFFKNRYAFQNGQKCLLYFENLESKTDGFDKDIKVVGLEFLITKDATLFNSKPDEKEREYYLDIHRKHIRDTLYNKIFISLDKDLKDDEKRRKADSIFQKKLDSILRIKGDMLLKAMVDSINKLRNDSLGYDRIMLQKENAISKSGSSFILNFDVPTPNSTPVAALVSLCYIDSLNTDPNYALLELKYNSHSKLDYSNIKINRGRLCFNTESIGEKIKGKKGIKIRAFKNLENDDKQIYDVK